ncbi:hypothetical protein PV325_004190 [Microctonus aethiopoides]|nr:hypothetical protein PV325_004190 [Microctonus aethiopoides]
MIICIGVAFDVSSLLTSNILGPVNIDDNTKNNKNNFEETKTNITKRKSEIKCNEYRNAVTEKVWLFHPSQSKPFSISIPCKQPINLLISGGGPVESGQFPHMAAIGWSDNDGNIQYFCGGSLISENWILTAAHCTQYRLKRKPSVVRLGSNRLSDKMGEIIKIIDIIRHPEYKPPEMYSDIALLKLETSVIFRKNIRPACLFSQIHKLPMAAWTTGWGQTESDEDKGSDDLLKVRLEILDNVDCSLSYNKIPIIPDGITSGMLCAGDLHSTGKKDTCKGDSGGPLQILHPSYCLYELVGITSFGKLCGILKYPSVYTSISYYLEWIESIVWP